MKPKPRSPRMALWLAGLLLAVLLLCLVVRQSSVAQWLYSFSGFEDDSYKVYPTTQAVGDYFGRVLAKIRTQPKYMQTATSTADASTHAGFQVLSPRYLPEGFQPLDRYDITGKHAYEIAINLDEARRILGSGGLPTDALPVETVLDKISVDIPVSVTVHQSQGERWFTMIQGVDGQVRLPEGADPAAVEAVKELGLRYLGLTEQEARQFGQELGWAAFLVTPPTDMSHAEPAEVNGIPALVWSQSQADSGLHAVFWKANGVLYGLYGGLPVDELLKIASSME